MTRDTTDAEICLLTEQVKSPAPSRNVSTVAWKNAAVTLLILTGLLAVIFTILREDSHDILINSPNETLNLLVVGDWGRKGKYNQSLVAAQMGNVGRKLEVNFIISTGDNFYDAGLESSDDELFDESFSAVYEARSLQKPWFAVLGNHDYRGDPEVQVGRSLKLRDSRWHCDYTYTRSFDLGVDNSCKGESNSTYVEFFFIDTNPLEEDYWIPVDEHYTWTRPIPREKAIANQLQNLTSALEASNATWKLVVGHHTLYSHGSHGDTPELIEKVLPIMEANNVDMYINGHDHCLQHIKRSDSEIHFVTSGGGSKAWHGVASSNLLDSKLYYDGQGFISMSISPLILHVNFYDINGETIHEIDLKK